ncbi:hypothetical protein HDZ31DRAFT_42595 [Schizophyllum fasciatum]
MDTAATARPTPMSHPNINYRQIAPLPGIAQTTSTYDYWWPYPPGGVYTTITTPPVAPLIPTTTNLLAAPAPTIISDVNSILDLTLDGDSSSSFLSDSASLSTSSSLDSTASLSTVGPSVISLTALPPDTTSSAPNTSPKKLDRPTTANAAKYVVPVCIVAGVILGSLCAWFVYGCLRARHTRMGHGKERRRPRERLEAGTEYRYISTEGDDEEKALPVPPDDDIWDDKDYTLDLTDEHGLALSPDRPAGRAQDAGAAAAVSFRWPSAPFANKSGKKSIKGVSRARSMLSVTETDVMSLLSHGEDMDSPSKHDRLAANVLRDDMAPTKRRVAHAREQSDLRLEDLGIDLGRPTKYRVKRPAAARMQSAESSLTAGVHRANTGYSTYTVATKMGDGADEGVSRSDTRLSRATTVKSAYTDVSRANTVKSTYSTASAQRGGGFRIMVESPPSAASVFGQATPGSVFGQMPALPTPSKLLSSLFGSQEGDEDRYTPLPQRSRSRSASPVKPKGGRGLRSRNASPERLEEDIAGGGGRAGRSRGEDVARPSALDRPSHSAMDVLPQSPPLVSSPYLCFEAQPRAAPSAGFGWPSVPQAERGDPMGSGQCMLSPKPARGRGGRLVPKGGRRQGGA